MRDGRTSCAAVVRADHSIYKAASAGNVLRALFVLRHKKGYQKMKCRVLKRGISQKSPAVLRLSWSKRRMHSE